jgi:hypothetical protein
MFIGFLGNFFDLGQLKRRHVLIGLWQDAEYFDVFGATPVLSRPAEHVVAGVSRCGEGALARLSQGFSRDLTW